VGITLCVVINEIPALYTRKPVGAGILPDSNGPGHFDGQ
jgi:hypothetical protein